MSKTQNLMRVDSLFLCHLATILMTMSAVINTAHVVTVPTPIPTPNPVHVIGESYWGQ